MSIQSIRLHWIPPLSGYVFPSALMITQYLISQLTLRVTHHTPSVEKYRNVSSSTKCDKSLLFGWIATWKWQDASVLILRLDTFLTVEALVFLKLGTDKMVLGKSLMRAFGARLNCDTEELYFAETLTKAKATHRKYQPSTHQNTNSSMLRSSGG